MSAGQHSPGVPPSLAEAGRRDLRAIFAHQRVRTSDNRWAVWQGRSGNGAHLMTNVGSDILYSVAGPDRSFRPGQHLLVGSWTGFPGEVIIAEPSQDRKGVEAYPELRAGRELIFPAPEDPPPLEEAGCPTASITGHSYLGVFASGSAFFAERYNDHSPTGERWSIAHDLFQPELLWRHHTGGDVVVGGGLRDSDNHPVVFTWSPESASLVEIDAGFVRSLGVLEMLGPVVWGASVYWVRWEVGPPERVRLFRGSIGGGSAVELGDAVSDGDISWSAVGPGKGALVPVGTDEVLIAALDGAAGAGSRGVWTALPGGTLRVGAAFDEGLLPAGVNSCGERVPGESTGLYQVRSEGSVFKVNGAGVRTRYTTGATWAEEVLGLRLPPAAAHLVFYPTGVGVEDDHLMRVLWTDYTALVGCSTAGTGTQVGEMTDLGPGGLPDRMLPRD